MAGTKKVVFKIFRFTRTINKLLRNLNIEYRQPIVYTKVINP